MPKDLNTYLEKVDPADWHPPAPPGHETDEFGDVYPHDEEDEPAPWAKYKKPKQSDLALQDPPDINNPQDQMRRELRTNPTEWWDAMRYSYRQKLMREWAKSSVDSLEASDYAQLDKDFQNYLTNKWHDLKETPGSQTPATAKRRQAAHSRIYYRVSFPNMARRAYAKRPYFVHHWYEDVSAQVKRASGLPLPEKNLASYGVEVADKGTALRLANSLTMQYHVPPRSVTIEKIERDGLQAQVIQGTSVRQGRRQGHVRSVEANRAKIDWQDEGEPVWENLKNIQPISGTKLYPPDEEDWADGLINPERQNVACRVTAKAGPPKDLPTGTIDVEGVSPSPPDFGTITRKGRTITLDLHPWKYEKYGPPVTYETEEEADAAEAASDAADSARYDAGEHRSHAGGGYIVVDRTKSKTYQSNQFNWENTEVFDWGYGGGPMLKVHPSFFPELPEFPDARKLETFEEPSEELWDEEVDILLNPKQQQN